jgi:hypothetical protein
MLGHALLAVITAADREQCPADAGPIDMTCAEVPRFLRSFHAASPRRCAGARRGLVTMVPRSPNPRQDLPLRPLRRAAFMISDLQLQY